MSIEFIIFFFQFSFMFISQQNRREKNVGKDRKGKNSIFDHV